MRLNVARSCEARLADPRFSDPEAISANPPACFALRNRSTSRRALACTRHAHRLNPHS